MSIGVVGSRSFGDYGRVRLVLAWLIDDGGWGDEPPTIVSGGAVGADALAARFAHEHGLRLVEHLPDRGRYGWPRAAFERNSLIVDGCPEDCGDHPGGTPPIGNLVALFGPGEPPILGDRRFGSGTMDTVAKAMARRIPVHMYFE